MDELNVFTLLQSGKERIKSTLQALTQNNTFIY
jgi:hypothetical protein